MAKPDLPVPTHARNMSIIGYSDLGGHIDTVQVMAQRGYAYVGHIFTGGFSVVDVRDPRDPKPVAFIASPPNTMSLHLQAHDDILCVVHGRDGFNPAAADYDPARKAGRNWSAGMAIYDISDAAAPRQIGFLPVEGIGLHRIWYVGGRWAYASASIDGFTAHIMIIIDLADPAKPQLVGKFWLPGMNQAAGETPDWPKPDGYYSLHHPIVHGDTAYCSWRDGGLVIVDVADRSAPKMVTHKWWAPPYGGGTHNALPLPDRDLLVVVDEAQADNQEDGVKLIWMFDTRERTNPVSISTMPTPSDRDYVAVGGRFGPHNVHENRPGSFVSSDTIFATYSNAGVRAFDVRDPFRPVEIGALVPPPPKRFYDPRPDRPHVLQSNDIFVDRTGIFYTTGFSDGLIIGEFTG
jgi:hypothetical protein